MNTTTLTTRTPTLPPSMGVEGALNDQVSLAETPLLRIGLLFKRDLRACKSHPTASTNNTVVEFFELTADNLVLLTVLVRLPYQFHLSRGRRRVTREQAQWNATIEELACARTCVCVCMCHMQGLSESICLCVRVQTLKHFCSFAAT